jgi:hypothetical protein
VSMTPGDARLKHRLEPAISNFSRCSLRTSM